MTRRARRPTQFNLLRLKSKPTGALITFVKSDFDEKNLEKLVRDVRYLSESNEYSLFCGTYMRKNVNFLGTGSGPASLLTALYELVPSKIQSLVRIGASGGLGGTRIQTVVNVRTAICMDAVSSTLTRTQQVFPDVTLAKRISETLSKNRIKSMFESAVSVDAMYLFEQKIDRAETQGAYCWDLETATTLAFGRKFNVRAASVLYIVSDKAGKTIRSYPPIRNLRFVSSVLEAISV